MTWLNRAGVKVVHVSMPMSVAKRLLQVFWHSQLTTAHAAENEVCAYGCGEPYTDFVAHEADCDFVKEWESEEMVGVRQAAVCLLDIKTSPRPVTGESSHSSWCALRSGKTTCDCDWFEKAGRKA